MTGTVPLRGTKVLSRWRKGKPRTHNVITLIPKALLASLAQVRIDVLLEKQAHHPRRETSLQLGQMKLDVAVDVDNEADPEAWSCH